MDKDKILSASKSKTKKRYTVEDSILSPDIIRVTDNETKRTLWNGEVQGLLDELEELRNK